MTVDTFLLVRHQASARMASVVLSLAAIGLSFSIFDESQFIVPRDFSKHYLIEDCAWILDLKSSNAFSSLKLLQQKGVLLVTEAAALRHHAGSILARQQAARQWRPDCSSCTPSAITRNVCISSTQTHAKLRIQRGILLLKAGAVEKIVLRLQMQASRIHCDEKDLSHNLLHHRGNQIVLARDGMCLRDVRSGPLRRAPVEGLALVDDVGHSTHSLLNGRGEVCRSNQELLQSSLSRQTGAMTVEQVHVLELHALETRLKAIHDVLACAARRVGIAGNTHCSAAEELGAETTRGSDFRQHRGNMIT
jgi:hypothetical protein